MADRAELEQLRKRKRLQELEARVTPVAPQTEESPAPEESAFQRFGRGMAQRATTNVNKLVNLEHSIGNKLLNLVGVDMPMPEDTPYSTKSIREQEQSIRDAGGAGEAGAFAADVIQTAPLGLVGRGMQAARSAPVVGRVLGNRPAQAAVEGGLSSLLVADPEERMGDVARGAATGVALERGGRALGRTMEGLVKRSPEAKAIEQVADLHGTKVQLPLSAAASDEGIISPFAKFLYGRVLPAVPGTSGALGKQSQRAGAQLREIAMKEAAPGGMGNTGPGYAGGLEMTTGRKSGAGENVRVSMGDIQKAFDREYKDTIGSYAFNPPDAQDFMTQLQRKFPNIDNSTLTTVAQDFDSLAQKYSKKGVLQGENLMRMKAELAGRGRTSANDLVGQSYAAAQDYLDNLVKTELSQGNNYQNMVDLQRYQDLAEPWKNFQRVQRAAARSADPEGKFTPGELMRAAKSMSNDAELARGTAPMQELASIGARTVGAEPGPPSFLERGMTWSALAGLGLASPVGAGATIGGARALSSPAVQDVLMGTNEAQRAMVEALRRRPDTKRLIGAEIRNLGALEAADDE